MLAALLVLLSAVAGLPGSAERADAGAWGDGAPTVRVDGGCCGGVAADDGHPCAPGESCPPSGGCCACVSCVRIVAVSAQSRSAETGRVRTRRVPRGTSSGIDGGGAVWHPPRG